jgi:hypothetical protein
MGKINTSCTRGRKRSKRCVTNKYLHIMGGGKIKLSEGSGEGVFL